MLVVWEIGKREMENGGDEEKKEENCSQTKHQRPMNPNGFARTQ